MYMIISMGLLKKYECYYLLIIYSENLLDEKTRPRRHASEFSRY